MNKYFYKQIFFLGFVAFTILVPNKVIALSDDQIKKAIIEESIKNYSGNCPCPYNRDRAGRKCGKRSAYSRPGGASPICYPEDVTPEMIEAYRKKK